MALFDRLSEHNFLGLLRVGFGARLRSEVADIFLTAGSDGTLKRTDKRAEALVLFFQSGDNTIKPSMATETLPQSALCAVLAAGPSSTAQSNPLFLNISDQPVLSSNPGVVKISLQSAPNAHRILISFASAGPDPKHITLRGVACGAAARSVVDVCKFATFHLEILVNTIGKGFAPDVHHASQLNYVTPAQAFTHALLQLNVRFRLTSVHKSVLASSPASSADSDRGLAFVQHNVSSPGLTPLVLSAFSFARSAREDLPSSSFYSLTVADSSPTVSLYIPKLTASAQDPVLRKITTENCSVCINALPDAWGAVNLGICEDESSSSSKENGKSNSTSAGGVKNSRLVWLMAGPRGKAEVRPHRRHWETFYVEYVEQSLTATWNELPIPRLYTVADRQTRASVRATIEQNLVAASSNNLPQSASSTRPVCRCTRNGRNSAFNHAAALAGLSEDNNSTPSASTSTAQTHNAVVVPKRKGKGKGKKAKTSSRSTTTVAQTDAARSSLPRNAAHKKAAKKNRKKSREPSGAASTSSTGRSVSASASDGGSSLTPPDSPSPPDQSQLNIENSSNSEPPPKGSTTGPEPACCACGRAINGTSTRAMGKVFHPQCFRCGHCRRPIGTGNGQFREKGGIPYCRSCYANHLAARCARCAEPILETVTTAMDKTWHKNCLTCTLCRLPLTETFWLYADRPNEPRCSRCVTGEEHSSLGRSNRRMVNLPGFHRSNSNRPPFSGAGVNEAPRTPGNASPDRGSARLHLPSPSVTFPR